MKIIVDDNIPYVKGILEPYAEVSYLPGDGFTREKIADATALIVRTRTRCDRTLLEGTQVSMIASATIGYDHIDTEYCAAAGIKVATAPGANARAVLQWVGAALVHASEAEGWDPCRKTIGVAGVGHVGSLVAEYARLWGFGVVCCDPPRRRAEGPESPAALFTELDGIIDRCDIITFHTPLTRTGPDATFHMADAGFFGAVRPGTLIINSSRGEVVDTRALLAAVIGGRCGCCIDTWENEPRINRVLLSKSPLSTPHIAGYSVQGKANAASIVIRAVSREYGLPLGDWYPGGIEKVEPAPISWEELRATIRGYFDIRARSRALKSAPESFEDFRNNCIYRQEYF